MLKGQEQKKREGKILINYIFQDFGLITWTYTFRRLGVIRLHSEQFWDIELESNPSHEHLTLTWNTILQLFIHHTYISNIFYLFFYMSDLYTHDCLYCIVFLLFCTLPICIFVYCYFVVCVLSCCCHSVALWSFCHYKFLICVNIPGQ